MNTIIAVKPIHVLKARHMQITNAHSNHQEFVRGEHFDALRGKRGWSDSGR